jgi:hypothetical protein
LAYVSLLETAWYVDEFSMIARYIVDLVMCSLLRRPVVATTIVPRYCGGFSGARAALLLPPIPISVLFVQDAAPFQRGLFPSIGAIVGKEELCRSFCAVARMTSGRKTFCRTSFEDGLYSAVADSRQCWRLSCGVAWSL